MKNAAPFIAAWAIVTLGIASYAIGFSHKNERIEILFIALGAIFIGYPAYRYWFKTFQKL